MRITVLPTGSWGDVQPFVALATGLGRRGHDVTVATHEPFRSYVTDCRLTFRPVAGDVQAAMESDGILAVLEAGGPTLPLLNELARAARRFVDELVENQWNACQGAEVVIASPWSLGAAYFFTRVLDVPLVSGSVYPAGSTRAHESILFGPAPSWAGPFGGAYNLLTHELTRVLMWYGGRKDVAGALRRAVPGARVPFRDPLREAERRAPFLSLFGYSGHVLPRPDDWPEQRHVTGFWTLAHEPGWEPPPGLPAFLDDGPPPVAIGFGSMSTRDPAATTRLVVEALERTGQRAVLLKSWSGLAGLEPSDRVFVVETLPYDWLFSRVSAVVHHGGAGAVSAAVRAGIPAVVVPSICDQRFWARRLHALGVAAAPIPRTELTAPRLAEALSLVLEPRVRQRAEELGARVRGEDGIMHAARLIEERRGRRRLVPGAAEERTRT